ncbi:unnamed protein product [Mycena citricolor]|uniref:Uncharacterized protein n=1 Tax=Mycena citricolor TaxID=2018698 RepID=A0AAD2JU37_9AGAR|nr:unnamed protein product [Mycena citricolor]
MSMLTCNCLANLEVNPLFSETHTNVVNVVRPSRNLNRADVPPVPTLPMTRSIGPRFKYDPAAWYLSNTQGASTQRPNLDWSDVESAAKTPRNRRLLPRLFCTAVSAGE